MVSAEDYDAETGTMTFMLMFNTDSAEKTLQAQPLTLVVLLSSIFVSIRHLSQIREDHIRRELAAGASEIVIFALPYEYTSWDHLWGQKYYNNTGRDVTFSSISCTMWMNDIYR